MLETTYEKSMISLITVAIAVLIVIASLMMHTWYVVVYVPTRRHMERLSSEQAE